MPRLLIGWELGAGAGHLHRLVPIIDLYLSRGWSVVAAVRARAAANALFARFERHLADGSLSAVQAPIFLHPSRGPTDAASLPELLAHMGFAEADLVRPVVGAWHRVLIDARPDAIISDMAPSLNIAARGKLPLIVIGNGWTIPPDTADPVPFQLRPGAQAAASEAAMRVLDTVSKVDGKPCFGRFSDLLRGSANLVCTLDLFDPYRDHRNEDYYWPVEIAPPAATSHERDRGFVYLPKNHPALASVLRAIEAGSIPFRGHFSGVEPSARNLVASAAPMKLADELPRSRLAVHHGGLGTAIECLIHGVPQMISFLDYEKFVITRGLEAAGAGIAFPPRADAAALARAFERVAKLVPKAPEYSRMKTRSPDETLSALCGWTG
ncbi:nucleotide disphospho-sugar-binding domain-containing protein [Sphingomonas sp. DT-204]|uniref:nucleotide disphospho-sugar-binding domain-containing protein n=1 Tax=Sphingomonas sp. DT-204 TaxID=3396166 RepID=UPI003F1B71EB